MNLFFPSSDTLSVMPELQEYSGTYSFTLNIVNSCAAPGKEVKVRCPLCNTRTTTLYCADCITTGNFTHSKGGSDERYLDKRVNVTRLRGEIGLLGKEIVKWDHAKLLAGRLEAQIEQKKKRNKHLKRFLVEWQQKIRDSRKQCAKIDRDNDIRRKGIELWHNSMSPSLEVLSSTKSKASLSRSELREYCGRLRRCRRGLISDLVNCVVPIKCIGNYTTNSFNGPGVILEVVGDSILEVDAQPRVVPVYSVAEPLLPDAENLLRFKLKEVACSNVVKRATCKEKQNSEGNSERCHVLNLSAALGNITLLVNVLAALSELHLPHVLSHAVFTDHNLCDEALGCRIAKLNQNIVYFCLAAGIPENKIFSPNCTIKNIRLLISHLPIRRDELSVVMTDAFEESLRLTCRGVTHASCYRTDSSGRSYLPYRNTPPHDAPESFLTDYHFVYPEDLSVSRPDTEHLSPL